MRPLRALQMPSQPSVRTLSGTVTDTGHEPIRGAIVQLRNQNSNQMLTYLTDANGRYSFKRLNGNADYDVHVIYRGRHSPSRSISKFDSHMSKVIDFTSANLLSLRRNNCAGCRRPFAPVA